MNPRHQNWTGKLHTVCFNMHCIDNIYIYTYIHTYIHTYNIYIYIGYKNRSTYSSYTAGFLQAQELSDALKPLQIVQSHLPGFQDFALLKHLREKKQVSTNLNVWLWQALVNQQRSCRHTHTQISTLFEIYYIKKKIQESI